MLKICCGKKSEKHYEYNEETGELEEEPKNVTEASKIGGVLGLIFVPIPFLGKILGQKIGRKGKNEYIIYCFSKKSSAFKYFYLFKVAKKLIKHKLIK